MQLTNSRVEKWCRQIRYLMFGEAWAVDLYFIGREVNADKCLPTVVDLIESYIN